MKQRKRILLAMLLRRCRPWFWRKAPVEPAMVGMGGGDDKRRRPGLRGDVDGGEIHREMTRNSATDMATGCLR
jgi:hypothetical protein